MRIAIFSSNFYPTPPIKKNVVHAPLWLTHHLAEGLTQRGHKVYLFCSSDSTSKAYRRINNGLPSFNTNKEWQKAYKKLQKETNLVEKGKSQNRWAYKWKSTMIINYEMMLVSKLFQMAKDNKFDVIQLHSAVRAFQLAPLTDAPVFYTLHDPIDYPYGTNVKKIIYQTFNKQKTKNGYFISISNAQRKPAVDLNYAGTAYNGIDINHFKFNNKKGGYLLCVGRILPQKGFHIAVKIAKKMNKRLKIVGPLPPDRIAYWNKNIKPYLSPKITYHGMMTQKKLLNMYQEAEALLMPITSSESFGLVMAEAMSCGTPVIGFDKGSVREVIEHGKTGFVVKNERGMIKAIKNIDTIKRQDCRDWVEENFSLETMIDNYEKLYFKILKKKK